jgi:hypothetical protein
MAMENKELTEQDLRVIATYGTHIAVASGRERAYRHNPEEISVLWSELRGNEHRIMFLAWRVSMSERPSLGSMYSPQVGGVLQLVACGVDEHFKEIEVLDD